jgi:biotin synthase-related radical SAM superfamily protein
MRYLALILLLSSCSTAEVEQVNKYDTLLLKVAKSQLKMDSNIVEATKKEAKIINKTVQSIIEDKKQIKELFSEVAQAKANARVEIQVQTIRDTVFVTEKKNFWGKSKKDTL